MPKLGEAALLVQPLGQLFVHDIPVNGKRIAHKKIAKLLHTIHICTKALHIIRIFGIFSCAQ